MKIYVNIIVQMIKLLYEICDVKYNLLKFSYKYMKVSRETWRELNLVKQMFI